MYADSDTDMKKDVEATISYWRDPGDGSLPDADHDIEILLGHRDEENRTMLIRDIRGTESSYSLDTNGFEVHTLSKRERDASDEDVVESEYFEEVSNMLQTMSVDPSAPLIWLTLTCQWQHRSQRRDRIWQSRTAIRARRAQAVGIQRC